MYQFRAAVLLATFWTLSAGSLPAAEELFGPDPKHPWNLLHSFLYVRWYANRRTFVYDGLEPPLGRIGSFLLTGQSHAQVLNLLDDFLKSDVDKLIRDPLKRALMQRDLWYVFDKLAEMNRMTLDLEDDPADHQPERRRVERRLARVIRRLGLSEKEIQSLPDNYTAALRSGAFPVAFDPKAPDRPFLPADLFGPGSPWLEVTRPGADLAAADHFEATAGKAVFSILFRVPAGRKAAEEYLAQLRPGAAPPDLPAGAMFALVRRTVLISDRGVPQATHLTEDVQIRVFPVVKDQRYYEWTLDRKALLAGKAGGLRARTPVETEVYAEGIRSVRVDPFERGEQPEGQRPLANCIACHARESGIRSVNTFGGQRTEGWQGAALTDHESQTRQTLARKRMSFSWGLFKGLCEEKP